MAEAVAAGPDEEQTLAEFPKNSREVIRVRRTVYQGRACLDVRTWYPDAISGEFKPGKGLALRLEQLADLKKALTAAEKILKAGADGGAAAEA